MGFNYGYDYGYMTPDNYGSVMPGLGALVGVVILLCVLMSAIPVLLYILQSVGLHTIAKRRGIRKPWLAWLPLGDVWIVGSISDQYQYVVKGKIRNRRKVLLGLTIGTLVGAVAYCAIYLVGIVGVVTGMAEGAVVTAMIPMVLILTPVMGVLAVLLAVFRYIALYDVFCSCSPDNGVLMLVLSIFFNITMPFFLFAIRKKDAGMPPRKPPVEPVYEPVAEQEADFSQL